MNIGLKQLALNAAKAAGRVCSQFMNREQIIADPDMQQLRIQICQTCPHLAGSRCGKCGCFTIAKTKLETEKCPVDKW